LKLSEHTVAITDHWDATAAVQPCRAEVPPPRCRGTTVRVSPLPPLLAWDTPCVPSVSRTLDPPHLLRQSATTGHATARAPHAVIVCVRVFRAVA
jgi:hypothetical protein